MHRRARFVGIFFLSILALVSNAATAAVPNCPAKLIATEVPNWTVVFDFVNGQVGATHPGGGETVGDIVSIACHSSMVFIHFAYRGQSFRYCIFTHVEPIDLEAEGYCVPADGATVFHLKDILSTGSASGTGPGANCPRKLYVKEIDWRYKFDLDTKTGEGKHPGGGHVYYVLNNLACDDNATISKYIPHDVKYFRVIFGLDNRKGYNIGICAFYLKQFGSYYHRTGFGDCYRYGSAYRHLLVEDGMPPDWPSWAPK